jgi:purine-binding chemotaxis protein CheW
MLRHSVAESTDRSAIDAILREQARRYARIPPESQDAGETEVLLFQLGAEQYAIELGLLQSVHPLRGITEVPGAPSPVVGILNVRGEVVTILDLAAAFGTKTSTQNGGEARVLLVDAPAGGRVGLLVDDVLGVRRLAFAELDRSWLRQDYAGGIAEARVILVNLKQFLFSERFDGAEGVRELRSAE